MEYPLDDAQRTLLDLFRMVSRVPRPSGGEQRIRALLIAWAEEHELAWRRDQVGNLVIAVPASPGCGGAPSVALQGHMDMVCEKLPHSRHVFDQDPIRPFIDGQWLVADGTTLGADNGIAIALALAVALNSRVRHPELELLFTVNEENGLTGAAQLDDSLLRSSVLINLDSEDDRVITIGCAGGAGIVLTVPLPLIRPPAASGAYRLSVGGLAGGHSGTDIGRGRASANPLLVRLLMHFSDAGSFRLAGISGGTAHNAIARDAVADFVISRSEFTARVDGFTRLQHDIRRELRDQDGVAVIECEALDRRPAAVGGHRDSLRALRLLNSLPHGVYAMSPAGNGLVQTSSNFALVAGRDSAIEVVASLRSSVASELTALAGRYASLAALSGAAMRNAGGYPAWQADPDSALLARARHVFRRVRGCEPLLEVVHAGLECGLIGNRYPRMEMISIGPTIVNPHSPSERLHLPSLEHTWRFLSGLLASYCSDCGSS